MRLRDLDAELLRWEQKVEPRSFVNDPALGVAGGTHEVIGPVDYFVPVETLAEAHGIRFLCPAAYQRNRGKVGTHSVLVFFEGSPVPQHLGRGSDKDGPAPRWAVAWHGFVTNGDAA